MEDGDILQRLQSLRLWQVEQINTTNGDSFAGQLSEEQMQVMQSLVMDPNWIPDDDDENFDDEIRSVSGESADDEFFNNIEKKINTIRSANGVDEQQGTMETATNNKMRGKHNLDETPVHGTQNINFSGTPLKNLEEFNMNDDELGQDENGEPKRPAAKRPFLRKGEGLTTRFKVPPDAFNLKNLPKYKYANRNSMSLEQKLPNKEKTKDRRSSTGPRLETANRSMRCNSSRRLTLEKETEKKKPLARSKTAPCVSSLVNGTKKELSSRDSLKRGPTINTSSNHPKGAWASAFDQSDEPAPRSPGQYKVEDVSYRDMRRSELDELQSFECHERRLSNENYKATASSMRQNAIDESFEEIPDSDGGNSDDEAARPYNHVKFSSHVDGIEPLETDTDTVMSERVDMSAFNDFSKTSTPHDKMDFAKFRAKLLSGEVDTNLSLSASQLQEESVREDEEESVVDETLTQQKSALLKRNELLQTHLKRLENEIQTYQRENALLIKMKQEHEIQKNALEREREDMEAKLQDERVRMEVYFHDERMKIKEKQDQLERRMKEAQKPNRKERDEVIRLNDKISHLEAELKAKEVKHGSAQARLRTQVRTLEKQLHEQKLEYDVMKRENKRLEGENVRLRRENNSKMLLEINKNIAKLAHTAPTTPTTDTHAPVKREIINRSAKSTVVAKVVSHFPEKTASKILSKSLPSDKHTRGSCTESEIENGFDDDEEDHFNNNVTHTASSYFKSSHAKHRTSPVQNLRKSSSSSGVQSNNNNFVSPVGLSNNTSNDPRREILNADGSKDIYYPNGNLKKISADGMVIRMLYFNKDIKETNIHDGTIKYYYAANNSWETSYNDGKTVLEFAE